MLREQQHKEEYVMGLERNLVEYNEAIDVKRVKEALDECKRSMFLCKNTK